MKWRIRELTRKNHLILATLKACIVILKIVYLDSIPTSGN